MTNIKAKISDGWLHCSFIVEMMGKPADHLQKTLKGYVDNLKKDKKIEFIHEDYADPEQVENSTLFTTFVEFEVIMKDITRVIEFCFDFMPSSVEIIEPTNIILQNKVMNGLLNDIQARLHKVDMVLKNQSQENKILKKNSSLLVQNSILLSLRDGKKDTKEIAKLTRIPEADLKKFLDVLVKAKKLNFSAKKYSLA